MKFDEEPVSHLPMLLLHYIYYLLYIAYSSVCFFCSSFIIIVSKSIVCSFGQQSQPAKQIFVVQENFRTEYRARQFYRKDLGISYTNSKKKKIKMFGLFGSCRFYASFAKDKQRIRIDFINNMSSLSVARDLFLTLHCRCCIDVYHLLCVRVCVPGCVSIEVDAMPTSAI